MGRSMALKTCRSIIYWMFSGNRNYTLPKSIGKPSGPRGPRSLPRACAQWDGEEGEASGGVSGRDMRYPSDAQGW